MPTTAPPDTSPFSLGYAEMATRNSRLGAGAGSDAVDVESAQRGEQVGAEGQVGTAAALQGREHLGEGLGHQVVDIRGRDELAAQSASGLDMAGEEHSIGLEVAGADR